MKDYSEMAKSVFERKDKYNAERKIKRITGAVAACLCLVIVGGIMLKQSSDNIPNPKLLQIANPMMKVDSVKEMESYLDFKIPILNKEVSEYVVFVINGYPEVGRIYYEDGSIFSIKYGNGDISGVFGGTLDVTVKIKETEVSFYIYDSIRYAIWESNGFTYSLTGTEGLEEEVEALIP